MNQPAASPPEAIILLHGFGGHPVQTALLARRLRGAGFVVCNIGYPSWRWPIDRIVEHIHARIAPFAKAQVGPVHCVGHSMGGLVLRAYLARHRPPNLGRVVMLGTPNGGSEIADLLYRLRLHGPILYRAGDALRTRRQATVEQAFGSVDYPLGIIAGDRPMQAWLPGLVFRAANDGKVSVAATHLAGQADHLILPVAHTAMIYTRPVVDQVVHFLRDGQFRRDARP